MHDINWPFLSHYKLIPCQIKYFYRLLIFFYSFRLASATGRFFWWLAIPVHFTTCLTLFSINVMPFYGFDKFFPSFSVCTADAFNCNSIHLARNRSNTGTFARRILFSLVHSIGFFLPSKKSFKSVII